MENNYDLSTFIKNQQAKEKKAKIKLDDDHIYVIKNNAWSYLKLLSIYEKYNDKSEKLGPLIIKTFLGNDALEFIEGTTEINGEQIWNVPQEARVQIVAIIVHEISGINQNNDKKKI